MYVVSTLTKPTAQAGATSVTEYYYGGAQVTRERGFLGFRVFTMAQDEDLSNMIVHTEFEHQFPHTGMPYRSAVRLGDDLISLTTNRFAVKEFDHGTNQETGANQKTVFPFIDYVVTNQYEPNDGNRFRITTQFNAYDDYGNLEQQTNQVRDADNNQISWQRATTAYETPDLTRWLLARPQRVTNDARTCLLYTSPSPRDKRQSRMPSSA